MGIWVYEYMNKKMERRITVLKIVINISGICGKISSKTLDINKKKYFKLPTKLRGAETMKTKKQVIENNQEYAALINAVVSRIGLDSIKDVNKHGMSGGFSNFIYYTDTVNFFSQYKKIIMKLVKNEVDQFRCGVSALEMIQGLDSLTSPTLKNSWDSEYTQTPVYTLDEIAEAIHQGRGEYAEMIINAVSWFAAETVCRMFEEWELKHFLIN